MRNTSGASKLAVASRFLRDSSQRRFGVGVPIQAHACRFLEAARVELLDIVLEEPRAGAAWPVLGQPRDADLAEGQRIDCVLDRGVWAVCRIGATILGNMRNVCFGRRECTIRHGITRQRAAPRGSGRSIRFRSRPETRIPCLQPHDPASQIHPHWPPPLR